MVARARWSTYDRRILPSSPIQGRPLADLPNAAVRRGQRARAGLAAFYLATALLWDAHGSATFHLERAQRARTTPRMHVAPVVLGARTFSNDVGKIAVPAPNKPRVVPAHRADFWRALSNCEDPTGKAGAAFVGYFELSPDTAHKVGILGDEPYAVQRAAAIEWTRRLRAENASPGEYGGWPVCWWVAKRAVGYAP